MESLGPEEQGAEPRLKIDRKAVWIEDALILICLGTLWFPIAGYRGLWVTVVLTISMVTMFAVLVRRKRRVDRLFEELRRQHEEMQRMGAFPTMPGMVPPMHAGRVRERPLPEDTPDAEADP